MTGRQVLLLIGGTVALWVLAAYPASQLGGETALVHSAVAMSISLLPAVVTLVLANWAFSQAPEQQLLMILGGSGIRMMVVLTVCLLLSTYAPYFQPLAFWIWVLLFYLFVLGLEVVLLVLGRSAAEQPAALPGE